jgi:Fic family protein
MRTESLVITPVILGLIAEIDEFKGAWRALGRLAPERLRQLRKVATIESVGSSTRIEGARLLDQDVEELLGPVQAEFFTTRDEQEVAGYAAVMEMIFASYEAIPITENYIKQLHATLLKYSDKDTRHRGEYKKLSNQVEAFDASGKSLGIIFETATPFGTPREMESLVGWFKEIEEAKTLHPLIAIGIFVVVFLAIHPFQDGNGRLSRALTTLLLLRAGYGYVPYSSLENVIEENKDGYYLALRRTQGTLKQDQPDWSPWLTFFLQALAQQKRRLEAKVERERILRSSMSELSVNILELAAQHGGLSVADLVRLTGAPLGTVKKRLSALEKDGHLKRVGQGRATRYIPV